MTSEIIKHVLMDDFNEIYKLNYSEIESIVKNREKANRISIIFSDFSRIFLGKREIDKSNMEEYMPSRAQYRIAKEILEGTFDYSLVE